MRILAVVVIVLLALNVCFVDSATLVGDFLNSKITKESGIMEFDLETLKASNVWNVGPGYMTACYRQDQALYYVLNRNIETEGFYVFSLDITTGITGKNVTILVNASYAIFNWGCDTEYGLVSAFFPNSNTSLYIYSTDYTTGSTNLLVEYHSPFQMSYFMGSQMLDTVSHSLYFQNFIKQNWQSSQWGAIIFIPLNGSAASVFDYFSYQSDFQSVVYNAPTNTFIGVNVSVVWESENQGKPFEYIHTEKGVIREASRNFKFRSNYVTFSGETSTFTNIGSPKDTIKGMFTVLVGTMLTADLTIITVKGPQYGSSHLDYFYNNGTQHLTAKVLRPGNIKPYTFIQLIEN
eukprot:TRINITY_DN4922_c0_g1_i1.p1 TRINITY_DN4922_c0_g1~~TRINITY_DN4922_c0_g1_i1.p1  ORF type:complete len:349 (+),score=41.49 TRINITY_DN4922_c0_g1_i1:189-1235(+)